MWYVAQVQAGRESATRDLCLRLVSPDVLEECFMPEYETMWRVRGEWKLARRLLFPGYLFFVTGDAEELNKELLRLIELLENRGIVWEDTLPLTAGAPSSTLSVSVTTPREAAPPSAMRLRRSTEPGLPYMAAPLAVTSA